MSRRVTHYAKRALSHAVALPSGPTAPYLAVQPRDHQLYLHQTRQNGVAFLNGSAVLLPTLQPALRPTLHYHHHYDYHYDHNDHYDHYDVSGLC